MQLNTPRKSGINFCYCVILQELVPHLELTLKVINRLKEMGVRLSIDDFGTGYSSLTYLERFNADVLKIDKFFIKGVPDDHKVANIVKTIIAMAHIAWNTHWSKSQATIGSLWQS